MKDTTYRLRHYHNGKKGVHNGNDMSTDGSADLSTVADEMPWDTDMYQRGKLVRIEKAVRTGGALLQVDKKGNPTYYRTSETLIIIQKIKYTFIGIVMGFILNWADSIWLV